MPVSDLQPADFLPKRMEAAGALLRTKTPLTSAAFDQLKREAKARAFRMAGVSKITLIEKAQRIITRGLRDGLGNEAIRNRINTAFRAAGVKPLAGWHLRVVLRQNMLGAASVARDRVLRDPAVLKGLPYWQYMTVGNGKPGINGVRPEHAALHGKVFLATDRFWLFWTPLNGWNCRCTVTALTAGTFKRMSAPLYTLNMAGAVVRSDGKGKAVETQLDPEFAYPVDVDRMSQFMMTGVKAELARLIADRFEDAAKKVSA